MTAIPTRADMLAALADPDPANPLAAAIGAAIMAFGDALNTQVERAGAIPDAVILPAPSTEIEAFALDLFVQELSGTGIRVKIKCDS
jgi:hypothetical protein